MSKFTQTDKEENSKEKNKIRPKAYTIENFPSLCEERKELYEEFRKQVIAIDPCINETFQKYFISYKAETNFVDLMPRALKIRLILNMKFDDINDPRGLCSDLTGKMKIGNGDVSVEFSSKEEISYIISLVRQSYDRQMLS